MGQNLRSMLEVIPNENHRLEGGEKEGGHQMGFQDDAGLFTHTMTLARGGQFFELFLERINLLDYRHATLILDQCV